MKIGEIAEAAGLSASRIRFYERRGLIPTAARRDNGYRDYPPEVVGLLGFIELAQSLGFTLREIADARPALGERVVSCDQALSLLGQKLTAVSRLIAEAENRKSKILELMERLQATTRQSKSAGG